MSELPNTVDVIALGGCYLDINQGDYPFASSGIPTQTELVGGTYELAAGGSAVNFCRLLQSLGTTTGFIGVVGADVIGDSLESQLRQAGVRPLLIRRPDAQTGISFNMTNPAGEHIMLVAGTANAQLSEAVVLPELAQTLPSAQLLFIGGCFKLTALKAAYSKIVALAAQADCKVAVDHARIPAGTADDMRAAVKNLVLGADYYFPSRDEFCDLWGVDTIESGLQQLHLQAPKLTAIVKDGANGAFVWMESSALHIPAMPVASVKEVTGAGDSFNAGVLTAFAKGSDVPAAIKYGCEVAAAKISGRPLPQISIA